MCSMQRVLSRWLWHGWRLLVLCLSDPRSGRPTIDIPKHLGMFHNTPPLVVTYTLVRVFETTGVNFRTSLHQSLVPQSEVRSDQCRPGPSRDIRLPHVTPNRDRCTLCRSLGDDSASRLDAKLTSRMRDCQRTLLTWRPPLGRRQTGG